MLILYETTLILTDVAMSNKVEREEVTIGSGGSREGSWTPVNPKAAGTA
jgi:hypothetical protein